MSVVFAQLVKQVSSWRCRWPANELARRGYDVRCYADGAQLGGPAEAGDTVVLHLTPELGDPAAAMRMLKGNVRRVVVQLDDDWTAIRDIQRVNAAAAMWLGGLYEALHLADAVVVATPVLADAYRPWCTAEPVVIRNYPPRELGKLRARHRSGAVGWMGRLGVHSPDILPVVDGWPTDGVPLALIGAGEVAPRRDGQVIWWMDPTDNELELYAAMASCSVGIAPLQPTVFNAGKSWNKALEFLTLGVPVIASSMPAYEELAARVGGGLMIAPDIDRLVAAARAWAHLGVAVELDPTLCIEAEGGDAWETFIRDLEA